MTDQPRYLDRRPGHDYTERRYLSVFGEPEAISAEYQEELTERSHRAAADQLAAEWLKARGRVVDALAHFETTARPGKRVRSTLRVVVRTLDRVDRDLGAR